MEAGPKWQIRSDFQVGQNQPKFAMSTLFLWKNVHVFFPQVGKQGFKHVLESLSPLISHPPSPSNSVQHTRTVFWLSRIEILHWRWIGGEGGGWIFVQFCPYLFCLLNTKRVNMANFSGFWANLENRYKIVTCGWLAWSHSNLCISAPATNKVNTSSVVFSHSVWLQHSNTLHSKQSHGHCQGNWVLVGILCEQHCLVLW